MVIIYTLQILHTFLFDTVDVKKRQISSAQYETNRNTQVHKQNKDIVITQSNTINAVRDISGVG